MELNKNYKIIGKPGAGKTTYLVNLIKESEELRKTMRLLTFTRAATFSLISKLRQAGVAYRDWSGRLSTVHSLCYKFLGIDVLKHTDLAEFWFGKGFEFDPYKKVSLYTESNVYKGNILQRLIDLYRLARNFKIAEIKAVLRNINVSEGDFLKIMKEYEKFKKGIGKIDFIDMITYAIFYKFRVSPDLVIIDEAQDLNPLMWTLIQLSNPIAIWLSGDPLQTIYSFQGSDPNIFNRFKGEIINLNKSNRFGFNVKYIVQALYPNEEWYGKPFVGKTLLIHDLEQLLYLLDRGESVFILFRTNTELLAFANLLYSMGVDFDIEYTGIKFLEEAKTAQEMLKNGLLVPREHIEILVLLSKYTYLQDLLPQKFLIEYDELLQIHSDFKFIEDPIEDWIYDPILLRFDAIRKPGHRIRLSTLHQSKGLEATTTVLLTSPLSEKASEKLLEQDLYNEEIRLMYVAASRAKHNFYVGDFLDILEDYLPHGIDIFSAAAEELSADLDWGILGV